MWPGKNPWPGKNLGAEGGICESELGGIWESEFGLLRGSCY